MGFFSTFALELINGAPTEAKVIEIQEAIEEDILEIEEEN